MTKNDGSKWTSAEENAEVFKIHFEQLYDRKPTFDPTVLDLLDQHPVMEGIQLMTKFEKQLTDLKTRLLESQA